MAFLKFNFSLAVSFCSCKFSGRASERASARAKMQKCRACIFVMVFVWNQLKPIFIFYRKTKLIQMPVECEAFFKVRNSMSPTTIFNYVDLILGKDAGYSLTLFLCVCSAIVIVVGVVAVAVVIVVVIAVVLVVDFHYYHFRAAF